MAFRFVQGHKWKHQLLPPPHQERRPPAGPAHRGVASHPSPHMGTSLSNAVGYCLGTVECPPPRDTAGIWTQWNNRVMLRYLMSHNPPPPRQTPETWDALRKLQLPQGDLTFIQMAFWKKLPVGDRLKNWLPHATQCPLDGQVETIAHAPTSCRFLAAAFHIA